MIDSHTAHPVLGYFIYGLLAFIFIGATIHEVRHQRFIDRILQRPRQAKDNSLAWFLFWLLVVVVIGWYL